MTEKELYEDLEKILELEAGTIKGKERLNDLQGWDSMAMLGLIALIDRKLGITLPVVSLAACETLEEIKNLVLENSSSSPDTK